MGLFDAPVFAETNFPKSKKDFHWVDTEEIHAARRKIILKKYPQMKELFGPEIRTLPIVLAILVSQIAMAYWVRDKSWPIFLACAYVFGGTVNHTLQLAAHELSHNMCFHTPVYNKILAIMSNFVTTFPSAILFQRYHMEHHQYQGVDGVDTDIPTLAEIRIFKTSWFKVLWLFLQPAFYALRPVYVKPKSPQFWDITNFLAVAAFDVAVYYYLGGYALLYLTVGTLLGLGLHPCAGHFVAEHYEFVMNYETYSYYGSCNYLNFNVGYHNEHHDFPKVAWSRLAEVAKVAPEFYKDLPCHKSYWAVLYHYVTDPEMGPFSRIKRVSVKGGKVRGKKFQ